MWVIKIGFPHRIPDQWVCNGNLDYSENREDAFVYESYGDACAAMSHCYSTYGTITVERSDADREKHLAFAAAYRDQMNRDYAAGNFTGFEFCNDRRRNHQRKLAAMRPGLARVASNAAHRVTGGH